MRRETAKVKERGTENGERCSGRRMGAKIIPAILTADVKFSRTVYEQISGNLSLSFVMYIKKRFCSYLVQQILVEELAMKIDQLPGYNFRARLIE